MGVMLEDGIQFEHCNHCARLVRMDSLTFNKVCAAEHHEQGCETCPRCHAIPLDPPSRIIPSDISYIIEHCEGSEVVFFRPFDPINAEPAYWSLYTFSHGRFNKNMEIR